jgi:hypothetical protein
MRSGGRRCPFFCAALLRFSYVGSIEWKAFDSRVTSTSLRPRNSIAASAMCASTSAFCIAWHRSSAAVAVLRPSTSDEYSTPPGSVTCSGLMRLRAASAIASSTFRCSTSTSICFASVSNSRRNSDTGL